MNRRQIGPRVKAVLKTYGYHQSSVTLGQGTARHWVYIRTSTYVPNEIRDQVEATMVEERLCGSYYSDCGPGSNIPSPSVLWEVGIL